VILISNRDVEFEIDFIYDVRNRIPEFVIPKKYEQGEAICNHGLPVPPENMRLGYGKNEKGYLSGGYADAKSIFDLLNTNKHSAQELESDMLLEQCENNRILDFGCAAGRVTRWVKDFAPNAEVWGVDIDASRIVWANLALASRAHFVMTTKIPHLPFEDRSFSLVFAFSVFSHIDDLADAWLLELRRILDIGKCAVITIMDNSTIDLMQEKYSDYDLPKRLREYSEFYINRDFSMFSITRDSVPDVWYDIDYFKKRLDRFFDVLDVVPGFHGWQTGILLQK
jgi:ubiquinone/menaquinone biosynthesis C-methylase UbiE